MLIIKNSVMDAFIQHARKEAPIEACAYFSGADGHAMEIVLMTNIDKSADHFAFDPKEQFSAMRLARARDLTLLAVCHSHPASPARMSAEDIRLAIDTSMHYIIHSLMDNETRCFFFKSSDSFVEEDIYFSD